MLAVKITSSGVSTYTTTTRADIEEYYPPLTTIVIPVKTGIYFCIGK